MKLLVSALEPSSNEHLKILVKELPPEVELIGIFDESLGKPLYSPKEFSVMMFFDVLKKIFFFMKAQKQMLELAEQADKILFLDSSSFHIPLGKKIKKKFPHKEIIYYILPQVWAWKSWRAKEIEATFDRLGAILPFEVKYYKNKAQYVGHPLMDTIKHFRHSVYGDGIIFMPGSRKSEIKRIFPVFVELAQKFFPNKKKILVVPKIFSNANLKEIYGKGVENFEISFDTHKSLYMGEFAFICSGTATLEAALIGIPFVLGYKARNIEFQILKKMVKVKYIGLANIFFNALNGEEAGRGEKKLHPELLQDALNAESLFEAYCKMDKQEFFTQASRLREYLGHGSAKTIALWLEDDVY